MAYKIKFDIFDNQNEKKSNFDLNLKKVLLIVLHFTQAASKQLLLYLHYIDY